MMTFSSTTYVFQWKEDGLFMKIPQTISRTTGPNIGLFILMLMHFLYADSKYGHNIGNSDIFEKKYEKMEGAVLHSMDRDKTLFCLITVCGNRLIGDTM